MHSFLFGGGGGEINGGGDGGGKRVKVLKLRKNRMAILAIVVGVCQNCQKV
jgi:hypothetical protein